MRTTEVLGAPAGRARRPKDRRVRIAMAAAELFCAHGYHGVGIDDIAAAVGISGPAVYRHFPTKYAVLVEATRNLVEAAGAAPLAAALRLREQLASKRIALIASGGNASREQLLDVLSA